MHSSKYYRCYQLKYGTGEIQLQIRYEDFSVGVFFMWYLKYKILHLNALYFKLKVDYVFLKCRKSSIYFHVSFPLEGRYQKTKQWASHRSPEPNETHVQIMTLQGESVSFVRNILRECCVTSQDAIHSHKGKRTLSLGWESWWKGSWKVTQESARLEKEWRWEV